MMTMFMVAIIVMMMTTMRSMVMISGKSYLGHVVWMKMLLIACEWF